VDVDKILSTSHTQIFSMHYSITFFSIFNS
jgi:hypothetical protein